jgi:hypothetical protein
MDMAKDPNERSKSKDDLNEDTANTVKKTRTNKDVTGTAARNQKLARVKSMPSKLNTDSKQGPAATSSVTPKTLPPSNGALSRARTQSLKRINQPHNVATEGTPTSTRSMPNPPKPMAPRSVPKEPKALKDVTAMSKTSTPGKVIVFHAVLFVFLVVNVCVVLMGK